MRMASTRKRAFFGGASSVQPPKGRTSAAGTSGMTSQAQMDGRHVAGTNLFGRIGRHGNPTCAWAFSVLAETSLWGDTGIPMVCLIEVELDEAIAGY